MFTEFINENYGEISIDFKNWNAFTMENSWQIFK